MAVILIIYVILGAKANSFVKHNLFGVRTAYVFNLGNFIIDKLIMSIFLGWISIPVAFIMWCFGVRSR